MNPPKIFKVFVSSTYDDLREERAEVQKALLKSLSGHIPRSWLRSSDLLPFYHQYPAACCGDFLSKLLAGGDGAVPGCG
jgi:hypothetical protein